MKRSTRSKRSKPYYVKVASQRSMYFVDRDLKEVSPLKEQFEPTESQPIRAKARMAGTAV